VSFWIKRKGVFFEVPEIDKVIGVDKVMMNFKFTYI